MVMLRNVWCCLETSVFRYSYLKVEAQFVERCLLKPEIHSSNPVMDIFFKMGKPQLVISFIFGLFKQISLHFLQTRWIISIHDMVRGFKPMTCGTWVSLSVTRKNRTPAVEYTKLKHFTRLLFIYFRTSQATFTQLIL